MARSVHPGGLAANSKRIRPGDILVSLDDQPVEGKTLVEVHNLIQVIEDSSHSGLPSFEQLIEKIICECAGIFRKNA